MSADKVFVSKHQHKEDHTGITSWAPARERTEMNSTPARANLIRIRLTVTYFSSSWHHRDLAHPSKTKIKQFVWVTFKPALRASQIGIVPHPTQYMYYDVYICISIHLFCEILHCWSDIHFIFAWNTTTIPHCYCFCFWSAFAMTHQTSILLVVSVQSKDLRPGRSGNTY